jgi:hypothetical protein
MKLNILALITLIFCFQQVCFTKEFNFTATTIYNDFITAYTNNTLEPEGSLYKYKCIPKFASKTIIIKGKIADFTRQYIMSKNIKDGFFIIALEVYSSYNSSFEPNVDTNSPGIIKFKYGNSDGLNGKVAYQFQCLFPEDSEKELKNNQYFIGDNITIQGQVLLLDEYHYRNNYTYPIIYFYRCKILK